METSVNCDWLINELGPPPDAILRIPPPPVPHFMDREYLHEMAQAVLGMSEGDHLHNDSDCHWCHWARRIESTGTISGTTGTGKNKTKNLVGVDPDEYKSLFSPIGTFLTGYASPFYLDHLFLTKKGASKLG